MSQSSSSNSRMQQKETLTVFLWRTVATYLHDQELFDLACVSAVTLDAVDSDAIWRNISAEAARFVRENFSFRNRQRPPVEPQAPPPNSGRAARTRYLTEMREYTITRNNYDNAQTLAARQSSYIVRDRCENGDEYAGSYQLWGNDGLINQIQLLFSDLIVVPEALLLRCEEFRRYLAFRMMIVQPHTMMVLSTLLLRGVCGVDADFPTRWRHYEDSVFLSRCTGGLLSMEGKGENEDDDSDRDAARRRVGSSSHRQRQKKYKKSKQHDADDDDDGDDVDRTAAAAASTRVRQNQPSFPTLCVYPSFDVRFRFLTEFGVCCYFPNHQNVLGEVDGLAAAAASVELNAIYTTYGFEDELLRASSRPGIVHREDFQASMYRFVHRFNHNRAGVNNNNNNDNSNRQARLAQLLTLRNNVKNMVSCLRDENPWLRRPIVLASWLTRDLLDCLGFVALYSVSRWVEIAVHSFVLLLAVCFVIPCENFALKMWPAIRSAAATAWTALCVPAAVAARETLAPVIDEFFAPYADFVINVALPFFAGVPASVSRLVLHLWRNGSNSSSAPSSSPSSSSPSLSFSSWLLDQFLEQNNTSRPALEKVLDLPARLLYYAGQKWHNTNTSAASNNNKTAAINRQNLKSTSDFPKSFNQTLSHHVWRFPSVVAAFPHNGPNMTTYDADLSSASESDAPLQTSKTPYFTADGRYEIRVVDSYHWLVGAVAMILVFVWISVLLRPRIHHYFDRKGLRFFSLDIDDQEVDKKENSSNNNRNKKDFSTTTRSGEEYVKEVNNADEFPFINTWHAARKFFSRNNYLLWIVAAVHMQDAFIHWVELTALGFIDAVDSNPPDRLVSTTVWVLDESFRDSAFIRRAAVMAGHLFLGEDVMLLLRHDGNSSSSIVDIYTLNMSTVPRSVEVRVGNARFNCLLASVWVQIVFGVLVASWVQPFGAILRHVETQLPVREHVRRFFALSLDGEDAKILQEQLQKEMLISSSSARSTAMIGSLFTIVKDNVGAIFSVIRRRWKWMLSGILSKLLWSLFAIAVRWRLYREGAAYWQASLAVFVVRIGGAALGAAVTLWLDSR